MSNISVNEFQRNLRKVLGLPENEKRQKSTPYAPRILGETVSVSFDNTGTYANAQSSSDNSENGETAFTPQIPDWCKLIEPQSGQCVCIYANASEVEGCGETSRYVEGKWRIDDYVYAYFDGAAATVYEEYADYDENGLRVAKIRAAKSYDFDGGNVQDYEQILPIFEGVAAFDPYGGFAPILKALRTAHEDEFYRQVGSFGGDFVAFLQQRDVASISNEYVYFDENNGARERNYYKISLSGTRAEYIAYKYKTAEITSQTRRWSYDRNEWIISDEPAKTIPEVIVGFEVRFQTIRIPSQWYWTEAKPPVTECVPLVPQVGGFALACPYESRNPSILKNNTNKILNLTDEMGRSVQITALTYGGFIATYRGTIISIDKDWHITHAVQQ